MHSLYNPIVQVTKDTLVKHIQPHQEMNLQMEILLPWLLCILSNWDIEHFCHCNIFIFCKGGEESLLSDNWPI